MVQDFINSASNLENVAENQTANNKKSSNILKLAIDIVNPNSLPLMVISKNFKIEYISSGCYNLFKDYYDLKVKSFFTIFRSAFKKDELDTCIKKITSKGFSYSWSGTLIHNIRTARTILTRVAFLPLFDKGILSGYYVTFENITTAYWNDRLGIIKGLLRAAKMKDKDTGKHTERVDHYSKAIAAHMYKRDMFSSQVDVDFVESIGRYASMHDIGKIGTPDYILQKPSDLNDEEWKIMQEHTINGAMILSGFSIPLAQEIALSHHERWNGTGYPFRLIGEMIPLSARIVAVADVYDALRMKRPYKTAIAHDDCIEYMISESGTHFDPQIIELLKEIHPDLDEIWKSLEDKTASVGRVEHM